MILGFDQAGYNFKRLLGGDLKWRWMNSRVAWLVDCSTVSLTELPGPPVRGQQKR